MILDGMIFGTILNLELYIKIISEMSAEMSDHVSRDYSI